MSFGRILGSSSAGGRLVGDCIGFPYRGIAQDETSAINIPSRPVIHQPRIISPSLPKPMFNSPGLSLGLQTGIESHGDMTQLGDGNFNAAATEAGGGMVKRRSRETLDQEHDSRSGSGTASGDDQDAADIPPRKKRYHRHTPQQIQELEALFKECPHPDEKQRLELSKRLCLETRQVKFWFQNRRTQMKTQIERHENSILRQENDKLRGENMSLREAMRNPICTNCGGPAIIGEISLEEQHLRIENVRLKDELDRVCALAGKFLGRPIGSLMPPPPPQLPNSSLELGVGGNGYDGLGPLPDFGAAGGLPVIPPARSGIPGFDCSLEKSMLLELALAAMDELVKLAQTDEPLWVRNLEGGREVLNHEEYLRSFTPCIGVKPGGFVAEASRETGMVIINSLALVETLMDSNRWAEMFHCLIARTSTIDVIYSGMGGTRNGALHLMNAELQVLSPLVPVREVNFLRFCKQHAEGVWAVVDVSIDSIRETPSGPATFLTCRRLPSGCVVEDMPSGYSKVTWVEHAEYEESHIHQLYRPLISSSLGFGARRWVATLQRQCQCLAVLMSSHAPSSHDHTAITASGRRSMLKLAQRMTANFCAGVCASTVHKWNKLGGLDVAGDESVQVMTRKSVDDPGEPSGIVLSAATSVWLPVPPHRLFDFLKDEQLRSEWDILSNGSPMQEMTHIAKGPDHGNCVSLLRARAMSSNQSSMLILQETCTDASGSLVVYAPVDIPAMHVVMNGGDSAYVALLPSGFAIVPDGGVNGGTSQRGGGSLLTVAFQILVNSLPTAKLTVESVDTVKNLISCTIQKIRAAIQCDG
ncbi:hypothetical protein SAY86_028435 [Trapa natans]|uniref:Uncharacterized protein n=1 Tax=Trapa natans TaxID=22666 RepID=A0AAN7M277_TRANT|nr:hypothetical protein SAY86_028435 [Trapa natans]